MASVTYQAPEGDDLSVAMCGFEFISGEPVDVPDDSPALSKFKANRFFVVDGAEATADEPAPKRRGRPPKVADEPVSDDEGQ